MKAENTLWQQLHSPIFSIQAIWLDESFKSQHMAKFAVIMRVRKMPYKMV